MRMKTKDSRYFRGLNRKYTAYCDVHISDKRLLTHTHLWRFLKIGDPTIRSNQGTFVDPQQPVRFSVPASPEPGSRGFSVSNGAQDMSHLEEPEKIRP